jgi:Helix-turn-helix domain
MSERQAAYETDGAGAEPSEVRFRDPAEAAGFTVLPNAVLLAAGLTAAEIRLYALLRYYARGDGYAFPGQARLGERMGLKERQVRTLLHHLADLGLITITQRGLGKPNLYWIERLTPQVLRALGMSIVADQSSTAGQTGSPLPTTKTQS